MAIIYSYPEKSSPVGGDVLIITDSEETGKNKNRTKSLTIDNLAAYIISSTSTSVITGGGTLNTIAMFTPDGQKIGDSIITQAALGQGVTINGGLDVVEDLNVTGSIETSSDLNVTGNATFLSTITAGGGTGTAGQVLSSTGTGVEWISGGGGTVTGTGTTNTLPIWTDGPNGVLGDSVITQDPGNAVEITTGIPAAANCDYRFGVETFSGQKQGTTSGFEFKTGGQSGGYYKSGTFRFENKLAVGRDSNSPSVTLDVGKSTDSIPAAWFRNGVVVSNNPSGVQVDNTSMVIGAGNNDVVSGSDNCLAVGNNNQILNDSDNSLAVGQGNTIRNNSDNCFVIGQSNEIDGSNVPFGNSVRSQVLGYDNLLFGSYSCFIAGGDNNVQTPNNAFALGYSHLLRGKDSQFAFGENCRGPIDNTSQNSFMIGGNLQGIDGNMVIGFRNDTGDYPATDYANGLGNTKFVVSVGSVDESNAMIITEGGVTRGGSGVDQIPRIILPQQETLEFASDTDATAGGIPTGGLYRDGNDLKINFNDTAASGNEGLAYLTPQLLTASAGGSGTVNPDYNLVLLSWSPAIGGIYTLNLPLASANTNRLIRITTDGTLNLGAADKINITATGGETIDGNASFQISKRYEGLAIYSTGSEWIIVQAKAH
jgi:hypothetical protein